MHDLRAGQRDDADFLPHRSTTKEVTLAHISQLEGFAASRQVLIDTELLPTIEDLERFKRLALLTEARLISGVNEESLLRRIGAILDGADTLDDFVTTAGTSLDLVRLRPLAPIILTAFYEHCTHHRPFYTCTLTPNRNPTKTRSIDATGDGTTAFLRQHRCNGHGPVVRAEPGPGLPGLLRR